MIYAYLIYGLSFFLLWAVMWIYHMKLGRLLLAKDLWMIGVFAVCHGMSDWISMLVSVEKLHNQQVREGSVILLIVSFLFLLQFGCNTLARKYARPILGRLPLLLLLPLLMFVLSGRNLPEIEAFTRYLLGFPASLLAFWGLLALAPQLATPDSPDIGLYVKTAAAGFLVYASFTGLVVPEAGFFPATILNYRTFAAAIGLPVELFRAVCILVITFAMTRLLRSVELEAEASMRKRNEQLEERVAARTAEIVAEQSFRTAIEDSVSSGIAAVGLDGRQSYVNPAFCRMVGWSEQELLGARPPFKYWPPEDAHVILNNFRHALSGEVTAAPHEVRFMRRSGERFDTLIQTSHFNDGTGRRIGLLASITDISDRKRVTEALLESEQRFRAITENAIDGIVSIDENSRIVLANRSLERILGYGSGELDGRPLTDLMPERMREPHRTGLHRYVATGKKHIPWNMIELPGLHKDGGEVPLEISFGEYSRAGKRFFTGIIRDVTSRKEMESALRESERLRQLIVDSVPALISYVGSDLRYRLVNHRYETWWKRPASEIVGRQVADILERDRYEAISGHIAAALRGESVSYQWAVLHEGEARVMQVSYVPHRTDEGTVNGFFAMIIDITDRIRIEENLQQANERLSSVLNSITEAYYALDSGWKFAEINREAERILGPAPQLLGKMYWDLFPQNIGTEFDREYHTAFREQRPVHFEAQSRINNCWYEVHAYPRGRRLEVYFRDVSERKRLEEIITHRAYHDPLTDLPNRLLFEDIIRVEMAQARRSGKKLVIIFLDLDRFKEINDTFGHDTGDELLRQVAERLKKSIRESDTVARRSGDEFNLLLSDIEKPDRIMGALGKIAAAFRKPFAFGIEELRVTASIGASVYPDDSRDRELLLKYADQAMYDAKQLGKNRFRFYGRGINRRTLDRAAREQRLRQALRQGELEIYYLPEVDARSGKVVGAEALIRWNHPDQGLLPPSEFMPLAEESGLIIPVGEWVVTTVVQQVKVWQQATAHPVPVTVNLSERQFRQKDLAVRIGEILGKAGVAPRWLRLEIPERIAMSDLETAGANLRKLADLGLGLSLDNSGTGSLSLNRLKKLPFGRLKIDQSLIRDLPSDPDARMIVDAMIAMTQRMKIRAAAGGVETEEQLALLRDGNCDEFEGYLFSRPVPAREFERMIAA